MKGVNSMLYCNLSELRSPGGGEDGSEWRDGRRHGYDHVGLGRVGKHVRVYASRKARVYQTAVLAGGYAEPCRRIIAGDWR